MTFKVYPVWELAVTVLFLCLCGLTTNHMHPSTIDFFLPDRIILWTSKHFHRSLIWKPVLWLSLSLSRTNIPPTFQHDFPYPQCKKSVKTGEAFWKPYKFEFLIKLILYIVPAYASIGREASTAKEVVLARLFLRGCLAGASEREWLREGLTPL